MNKNLVLTLVSAVVISVNLNAQKFLTKNGHINFYSHTAMEDIKADNNQVASILDIATGEMVFNVLMKSFRFDRALMEEHFNENYVESDKFPQAKFKGKITNLSAVDFKKAGVYNVDIEGDMTIHGTTKPIKANGTLEVKDDHILGKSKFQIKAPDYNIAIPSVVKEKFAESLDVTVDMDYAPMKK